MFAELAHKEADTHLCVALHRKVRIRLHPSAVFVCGIIMCTISQLKVLDTSVHIVLSATRVVRNQYFLCHNYMHLSLRVQRYDNPPKLH